MTCTKVYQGDSKAQCIPVHSSALTQDSPSTANYQTLPRGVFNVFYGISLHFIAFLTLKSFHKIS